MGPLTNIALAVSKDPSIVPLVRNIVIMGGSIAGGNVNGAAEANIYGDPEAAAIVFNAGWMVTMIGSDVGERTLITRKHIADMHSVPGPESDFIAKLADFYFLARRRVAIPERRCTILSPSRPQWMRRW